MLALVNRMEWREALRLAREKWGKTCEVSEAHAGEGWLRRLWYRGKIIAEASTWEEAFSIAGPRIDQIERQSSRIVAP